MIQTISMLKEKYKDYANPIDKIKRDADKGIIIRLNRGLYETNRNVNPAFLAGAILSPSYLSFEYALSYYGLIPERVMAITSASLLMRKNKTYVNEFGRFEYSDIPPQVYPEEVIYIEDGEYANKIATKEKAICDSLYKWRAVTNINELKELLFLDKRFDEDEFASCDFDILLKIAPLYKRKNLDLLVKLIKKEYLHE